MVGERARFALFAVVAIFLLLIPLAQSYTPEFYYQSEQFNVSYNVQEVIDIAKELGYAMRIEVEPMVCRDENWTLDESGRCEGGILVSRPKYEYIYNGEIQVSTGNSSILDPFNKVLYVENDKLGVNINYNNYEFGAASVNPSKSLNIWHILITPQNESFDIEEAKSTVINEMQQLKIIEGEPILTFQKLPYIQLVLHSNGGYSASSQDSYLYIIVIVIIIIVIVGGVALYRRG